MSQQHKVDVGTPASPMVHNGLHLAMAALQKALRVSSTTSGTSDTSDSSELNLEVEVWCRGYKYTVKTKEESSMTEFLRDALRECEEKGELDDYSLKAAYGNCVSEENKSNHDNYYIDCEIENHMLNSLENYNILVFCIVPHLHQSVYTLLGFTGPLFGSLHIYFKEQDGNCCTWCFSLEEVSIIDEDNVEERQNLKKELNELETPPEEMKVFGEGKDNIRFEALWSNDDKKCDSLEDIDDENSYGTLTLLLRTGDSKELIKWTSIAGRESELKHTWGRYWCAKEIGDKWA